MYAQAKPEEDSALKRMLGIDKKLDVFNIATYIERNRNWGGGRFAENYGWAKSSHIERKTL